MTERPYQDYATLVARIAGDLEAVVNGDSRGVHQPLSQVRAEAAQLRELEDVLRTLAATPRETR